LPWQGNASAVVSWEPNQPINRAGWSAVWVRCPRQERVAEYA
jgi:hypothetical protein